METSNWSWESLQGELYHSSSITSNRKTSTFHPKTGRCFSTLLVHQEERGSSSSRQKINQWKIVTTSVKNHYTLNSVSSNGFFLYNRSSELLPFLYKITFLSFILWTCSWFAIRPHVPNSNSLLSPNKPILLGKYLAFYLFKVNNTNNDNS